MNNESYWQKTTTLPHYPKIKQDCTYDIVIVGGGMSGITLAHRLNDSNFNVALLESDTLASKTTGHTTGKVTCLHDVICVDICKVYGNDKAKKYFDSNNEALNEIKQIIEMNKIDCDFQENIAYIGASDKVNYEKILNQYLENRYDIDNLEFSIIISEKEKNKLEHISKQELKERNIEEQIKKQIKKQEDKLIKKIENFNFNWNKSIEANCIKYLATDKNGKNIEIQYIPNNQEKTDSVLLYDNQPLKYANYNINAVVNIIEKAIKDKLFEENIIQNLPF